MKNTTIIPFVIGYGKTGEAKTGVKHAMIKETLHYPNPMNDYRACIMRNTQIQDDKSKVLSMANKYFLFDKLLDETKQVFEFDMLNGETLVFFNHNTAFPLYANSIILENGNNKIEIKR